MWGANAGFNPVTTGTPVDISNYYLYHKIIYQKLTKSKMLTSYMSDEFRWLLIIYVFVTKKKILNTYAFS